MIKKAPKWLVVTVSVVLAALLIIFLLIPPVVKWYIEKHSEEWTGRKIRLEQIGLNPFTASVTITRMVVFEKDNDQPFCSFEELYVNIDFWRAVAGNIAVEEITLTRPQVQIIQHGTAFNFDDLVSRFQSSDSTPPSTTEEEPVHYWLEQLLLEEGSIVYRNNDLKNEIGIMHIIVDCPQIVWDNPHHQYTFSFAVAQGGQARGKLNLEINTLVYSLQYDVTSLNLAMLYPYMKDYLRISSLTGTLSTHQHVKGNFGEPEAVALSGDLSIEDFVLKDPLQDTLTGIGNLALVVDTIHVKSELYVFNSLKITKPYLKFELFDEGNNFSKLISGSEMNADSVTTTEQGSTVHADSLAIADGNIFRIASDYVRDIAAQYSFSNYRADSIVVRDGNVLFNDYTLHRKFNYELEGLLIKAERLNSENQNLTFSVASVLNKSGKLEGEIKVDPVNFKDIEINYTIRDLLISDFNPYSDYYIAHPFDGVCFYSSTNTIKARILKSENKLEIKKIIVGRKAKNNTAYNLPIRLAVALLRDVEGNILLEVPVEGDLNDPKYRFGKVIWQVFKNLISKAVAAPGKLLAKKSGVEEKYLTGFMWQPLQTELDPEMIKSLDALAKVLETTPELNAELIQVYNDEHERDILALKEGKKKFLFFGRRISSEETPSTDDEQKIESLSSRDSVFNAYLARETETQNTMLSSIDKSKRLVGASRLESKLQKIYAQRSEAVTRYMREVKQLPENRFRMAVSKEKSKIPYEAASRCVAGFFVDEEEPLTSQP